MKKKLIIDRRSWNRGQGGLNSGLLNFDDKMCCLGFYCLNHLELSEDDIFDLQMPSETGKAPWWLSKNNHSHKPIETRFEDMPETISRNEDVFAMINDSEEVDDDIREAWIKEGFKVLADIEVEFIN